MKICMLLPGHDFPPDIRVDKEAQSLQSAGHSVFIVCDRIRSRAWTEPYGGIAILRRKRAPVPLLCEKFNNIPFWNALLDRQWRRFIAAAVQTHSIEVLHLHDLPKAGAAIAAGREAGIPVVLDLHENFPGSMKTYVEGMSGRRRWAGRLLIGPEKWAAYERKQLAEADRIIAVGMEYKEMLTERGVPADKIAVVENTEPLAEAGDLAIDDALVSRYRNEFMILYLGGFGGRADHRGVTTAIEAMPGVLSSLPNARLVLVGKGSIRSVLDAMIRQRRLEDRVSLIDWVPQDKVYSYIAASTACLVPYNSSPNTEVSCPNKLFQYMYMRKPVVVSSCRSLKRYIRETGAGLVFQAGDGADLGRALVRLKDAALRAEMGNRGHEAVVKRYNWGVASRTLIDLYGGLARQINRARSRESATGAPI